MYMTLRTMRLDPARIQDGIGLAGYVIDRLNTEHGGAFGYSMEVGGDPTAMAIAGRWESLADYDAMRAAMAGDAELQSAIRMAATLSTDAHDVIGQVLLPPGERGAFAEVNQVRIHMPAAHAAIEFALEVAEYAAGKIGREVGLVSAVTGDRSQIMFVAYGTSLDDLITADNELEGDAEYQGFYKRSEDLLVPGSLERHFWQSLG